ncbi:MAG: helix-turn-helix transcriptional regulator, partial [Acidimicrobiia bacterium]
DGIWLVELSGVADPEHVADTILASVDVGEVAGVDAIDRLSAFLTSRRALLVLDTCEHLVEAAADAAHRLLASCPRLGVVATSREPLGVTGEVVWRVPPMTVGEHGEGDAVALFVERASAVRSNFTLNESNEDAVSAICRRLDGIPLAIELAAARVRSLSIKDIAGGLDDRFRLLAGGSRTALARQRTLEASVQWSYELTGAEERAVLRRLAVFQSGFDLPAAEQVAADGDVDELAVLDVVGRLVDKSLVQMEESPTGDVRYSLLDTIHQFGRDRLADAGEVDDTLARHLAWLRDLCEAAEPALHRGDIATLDRIDEQLDDVRVALAWACSDPDRAPAAVAIVGALGFYWLLRGRFREGIEWCRRALAAAPDAPDDAERMRARWALVDVLFYGSDPAESMEMAAALAADSAGAFPVFQARCEAVIGLAACYENPPAGVAILDGAVALALEAGDDFAMIDNHQCRAYAHLFQGNLEAAGADFNAVHGMAQRSGNGFHLGWDGAGLAALAVAAGDPTAAIPIARGGQAAARRIGESNSDAFSTLYLCLALADSGRPDEALREIAVVDELFIRRPGQLTDVSMAVARAYVLSSLHDDEAAATAARHCIDRAREGGLLFDAGYGILVTAAVRRRAGDVEGAVAALAEADEAIAGGHRFFVVDTALERARLWRATGEPDRAEESAHGALVTAMETGYRRSGLLALEELAHLSAAAGSLQEAARLLGACQAARQRMTLVPTPEEGRWADETTAVIVARLGDGDEAATAFAEGEQLSLDEAATYARRARGERGRPAAGWASLTPTERQVVDLVVDGLNNPQIAERLFMSRGTVKAHLAHVFAKLGVTSRAELAAVAARHITGA